MKKKKFYSDDDETLAFMSLDPKQNTAYYRRSKVISSCEKLLTEFFGPHWFKRDGTPKGNRPITKEMWKLIQSRRKRIFGRNGS